MVTRTGIESPVSPAFSRPYAAPELHLESSTKPRDASERVATELDASDIREPGSPLPAPSPDLFITAGAALAGRAARSQVARTVVEEILRRAVHQAALLEPGEAP